MRLLLVGLCATQNDAWVIGFCCKLGLMSTQSAEIYVLREGLQLLLANNLRDTKIASVIVVIIQNHALISTIRDCRSLLQQLGSPPLKHICREGNKCADILAREARTMAEPTTFFSFAPYCTRNSNICFFYHTKKKKKRRKNQ